MARGRPTIALVNSPIYSTTERLVLHNHIRALAPSCARIFVLTGNFPQRYEDTVQIFEIEAGRHRGTRPHLARRILDNLSGQLALARHLLRIAHQLDIVLFDIGEFRNPLPALVAKLLGKPTVVFHRGGDKRLEAAIEYDAGLERLVPLIQEVVLRVSYAMADHIVCEAESIIRFARLERYQLKTHVFGSSYVDTTRFRVTRPVEARENLIGCLGRLSRAKGALNLVKAMPKILRARSDVRLLVAGEGPEQATIAHAIQELGLQDHIDLVGLIPHSELPDLLNGLKLLVLPSYTEGIPAIMLEGMACGTPVVATPVGGIPDYVRDAETGFLISDQTPEGIAESVLKALTHPGLADVARKARGLVEERRSLAAGISEGQAFLSRVLARSLGGVHA